MDIVDLCLLCPSMPMRRVLSVQVGMVKLLYVARLIVDLINDITSSNGT